MLDHWVKNISTILSDPLNGLGITFILALIIVFINCKALWLQDQSLDTIMMTLMLFLVMAMFNSEKIDNPVPESTNTVKSKKSPHESKS
jgi:glucan phosphoethanolaminetransferase (alkaline phosphatase superfamily)